MRAALGLVQLDKLKHNNQRRAEATQYYQDRLREIAEVSVPFANAPALSSYHIFPILLQQSDTRQALMQFLRTKGIQSSIHYPRCTNLRIIGTVRLPRVYAGPTRWPRAW